MRSTEEHELTCEALIDVLSEARSMLDQPDNDFSRSKWKDRASAVADIDAILARIDAAETVKMLPIQMLFAPTGSLQEVSIESGWADEFIALASRFDDAIADL